MYRWVLSLNDSISTFDRASIVRLLTRFADEVITVLTSRRPAFQLIIVFRTSCFRLHKTETKQRCVWPKITVVSIPAWPVVKIRFCHRPYFKHTHLCVLDIGMLTTATAMSILLIWMWHYSHHNLIHSGLCDCHVERSTLECPTECQSWWILTL